MKAFQFIDEIDKSHLLVNGDEGQGVILNYTKSILMTTPDKALSRTLITLITNMAQ